MFLACTLASGASAREIVLARGGEAGAVVITGEDACEVEMHAAGELRYFLEKVTGAEFPAAREPGSGVYGIWVGTPENNPRAAGLRRDVAALSDEGYILRAGRNGLVITAGTPLGVLFGVYGFLEDHVGMRWFFPGEEGTYTPSLPVLTLGEMTEIQNPDFEVREIRLDSTSVNAYMPDTWDWLARNRMRLLDPVHPRWPEEHEKRGNRPHGGGHVMTRMVPPELFDEHPEYFPVYDGERLDPRKLAWSQLWNPCTTHPGVIDLAVEYVLDWFEDNPDGLFTINNNDWPEFCECENCVALDPPGEIGRTGGEVATRFFGFKNEVARRVWEVYPEAEIRTLAYHGFRLPPLGPAPEPRLRVDLCDHSRRCYRHSLLDETCGPNQWFREMFAKWSAFENPLGNYTYHSSMLTGGIIAAPLERVIADDIRFSHKMGHSIWTMNTAPPDGSYEHMVRRGRDPERVMNYWRANLHMHYIQAKISWDVSRNVDEILRDINMKYYGPAGDAMHSFRTRLLELWEETPGHFLRPSAMSLMGRSLMAPGAVEELSGYIEDARKAAAGDERYLRKVEKDAELFGKTWFAAHRVYSATAAVEDVTAARRTGAVTIDGVLDEDDWQGIDRVSGFVLLGTEQEGGLAAAQTYVRLLYDDENLYLGIEMEEPLAGRLAMDAMACGQGIFNDDTIEVFIDPDGKAESYVHIAVNPAGVFRDSRVAAGAPAVGDPSFSSGAEIAASVGDRSWTVEMRVPAEAVGGAIRDGGRWRADVGRARRTEPEVSTWATGMFHNPENFRTVAFARPVVGNGMFRDITVMDTEDLLRLHGRAGWEYGNEPPATATGWSLSSGYRGKVTIVSENVYAGENALKIENAGKPRGSAVFRFMDVQIFVGEQMEISFAARGEGRLRVQVYHYGRDPETRRRTSEGATQLLYIEELQPEWKKYELTYTHPSNDYVENAIAFWVTHPEDEGYVVIDDVFASPQN